MNKNEWWDVVDRNWVSLLGCIERFHPTVEKKPITAQSAVEYVRQQLPITAPNAEAACEAVRKTIKVENPLALATKAKIERDVEGLLALMQDAWYGAPESREVYSVPGFSLMCDLLEGPEDA